jgi:hypothetical protein
MARVTFLETVRRAQPTFWSAMKGHHRSSNPKAAQALCIRHDLVDDWILPQLWYDAGIETLDPGFDRSAVSYLIPTIDTVSAIAPEPEPASESRTQYVRRMARLAGARYDAVLAARIEKGSRRIVQKPQKHYDWLVNFVIGKKSFNAIWKESEHLQSATTVRHAVVQLAKILELTLRSVAPGRPTRTRKPRSNN